MTSVSRKLAYFLLISGFIVVFLSSYPIFFGKSYVFSGYGPQLLYDDFPLIPGYRWRCGRVTWNRHGRKIVQMKIVAWFSDSTYRHNQWLFRLCSIWWAGANADIRAGEEISHVIAVFCQQTDFQLDCIAFFLQSRCQEKSTMQVVVILKTPDNIEAR